jgi:hypothetical protein
MSQFPATTNTSCYAVAFRFESLAGWSYFAIFNQNPSHSNHHIPDNLTISGHLLVIIASTPVDLAITPGLEPA